MSKYRHMSTAEFRNADTTDPDYMNGDWYALPSGNKVWIYNFKWWFIQQHINSKQSCACKGNFT